jgi:hypothetical protein
MRIREKGTGETMSYRDSSVQLHEAVEQPRSAVYRVGTRSFYFTALGASNSIIWAVSSWHTSR